jgi:flagellar basal body-associated protein FliL
MAGAGRTGGIMKYGNTVEGISGRKNVGRMKSVWIWIAMALIAVAAAGCVSKPNDIAKNETVTTPVATYVPVTINVTPSTGQTEFHAPAPYQLYIKAGQIYQFTYGGIFHERRNFTVNYTSAYPTQIVKISFNGHEKTIRKEIYDVVSNLTSWGEGGFGFTLSPVSWEIRDGQRLPAYLSTWNTTELYLEVRESK